MSGGLRSRTSKTVFKNPTINNNPGFTTLLLAYLTGPLLYYRLGSKTAIKEARLRCRNYWNSKNEWHGQLVIQNVTPCCRKEMHLLN